MFKFNGEYKDLSQVEVFYPQFKIIHDDIIKRGKYPYNADFKGKIKGIKGNDEDTAIYLLQSLETQKKKERKIKELLADGFKEIKMGEGLKGFKRVVMVGTSYSKGDSREFEKGKILFENGSPQFIIPKRFSKRGIPLYGDKLVFAK